MSSKAPDRKPVRLMLTGGGTGGHLFPAVATAEKLCERVPGSEVLFVGTNRRLDREHLQRYGFVVKTIHCYGLKGKKIGELLKACAVLPLSLLQAMFVILKFKPQVVFGVGGYVTGPVIAAAWLLGKPTVIHEQNSVPGMANRKLGGLVKKVCISLPESDRFFPAGKTRLTGNPVRASILQAASVKKSSADNLTLLILGGSQGAHAVNELVTGALSSGVLDTNRLRVIHQTGPEDEQQIRTTYETMGIEAHVLDFFSDMAAVYAQADLVVSRAGATTLAELAVLGKPSVLIPFPFAADNHQQKNASWYVAGGGALMLPQQGLTTTQLAGELNALLEDPERLKMMSEAMKKFGMPEAADRIVDTCLSLVEPE